MSSEKRLFLIPPGVCVAWLISVMTYSRRVWLAALTTTPTANAKPNPNLTPANPPLQNFIIDLIYKNVFRKMAFLKTPGVCVAWLTSVTTYSCR